MVSRFLVFRSSFFNSSWFQSIFPNLYLNTGTANDTIIEFYCLHLILYPNLVSVSSSIPSSAWHSHSFVICQISLLCLNSYMLSSGPVL
jgi:hypothetical protein